MEAEPHADSGHSHLQQIALERNIGRTDSWIGRISGYAKYEVSIYLDSSREKAVSLMKSANTERILALCLEYSHHLRPKLPVRTLIRTFHADK